jgi:hypothetical protein
MAWWFILFWPIMGFLIFLGTRLDKRYPAGSVQRNRADLALGCGILALPAAPLIFWFGSIILGGNLDDSTVFFFKVIGVAWLGTIIFYGGFILSSVRVRRSLIV